MLSFMFFEVDRIVESNTALLNWYILWRLWHIWKLGTTGIIVISSWNARIGQRTFGGGRSGIQERRQLECTDAERAADTNREHREPNLSCDELARNGSLWKDQLWYQVSSGLVRMLILATAFDGVNPFSPRLTSKCTRRVSLILQQSLILQHLDVSAFFVFEATDDTANLKTSSSGFRVISGNRPLSRSSSLVSSHWWSAGGISRLW